MKIVNKILILSGDIDGNLGDAAIVLSTCESLLRLDKRLEIALVSDKPVISRKLPNIHLIPRGLRGLIHLLAWAKESDFILCGGGGLFQDDDSLVKMPYWALRLMLVRMFCRRIIGYSIGVGPLRFAVSRFFARLAFACMEQSSVRDPLSQATMKRATGKNAALIPDPALMLNTGSRNEAAVHLQEAGVPLDGTPLVGVAIRRWFHHSTTFIPHKYLVKHGLRKTRGQQQCRKMVLLIAAVLDRLVVDHGAFIVFMPTYNVSHEADADICRNVIEKMMSPRKTILAVNDPRRMFERKGVQFFLRAIAKLKTDWEILIAGDGPYLSKLKEEASINKAPVKFLGFVQGQQLTELYSSARIFISPSIQENFPMVLLEAMNAGCAVITTNARGCMEVVDDAAVLVEKGTVAPLKLALVELMNSPFAIDTYAAKGLKRAKAFYWSNVAMQYADLFQGLTA